MKKKKKTSVETINPYCFQICGLASFAVASHSRPAKRSGKRTPDKHCCPRQAGEVLSLSAECVPVIYQSSIPDPAGTNSSPWYPWELLSLKLSPPCDSLKGMRGFQLWVGLPGFPSGSSPWEGFIRQWGSKRLHLTFHT